MTNSSARSWVRHPTHDGGGAVLVEIQAVDTASRVDRGVQIRCPVVLERHDPYAHPTLDQLDLREMRDLARQLWRIVVRRGVVGDSVRRHREVRRIRARQKGRIRRLGPPGRRDRPHGDPADQPDEEGDGHIATPAAAEGGQKAIPGNSQHAGLTTSELPQNLPPAPLNPQCRTRSVRGQGGHHSNRLRANTPTPGPRCGAAPGPHGGLCPQVQHRRCDPDVLAFSWQLSVHTHKHTKWTNCQRI